MIRVPLRGSADRVVAAMLHIVALGVVAAFAFLLADLVRGGLGEVNFTYLVDRPTDAGRGGGILPIIVSTILLLGCAMASALPVGLGTALWLVFGAHRSPLFFRAVRLCLDALAAVPSIVFGLFGNVLFCDLLGMRFSILSGGLTLAAMILPIFIRASEEALRSVPAAWRDGALALGLGRTATLRHVILPAALPGILVAFTLAVARALAETAALVFTAGYVDRMPESLLDSGRSLAVHIYDLAMNVPGGSARAYAAALVLVTLLLIINFAAASISAHLQKRWSL